LNIETFKKEIRKELRVIDRIMKDYEKEGYIRIEEGWIYPGEKIEEMDISKLFP